MSYDSLPTHESTRKRRRWGCTCGCLFVLIFLLIGGSLGTYFLLRPIKPPGRYHFLTSQTNGYGVARLSAADSGIGDVIALVSSRLEQAQEAGLSGNEAKVMRTLVKTSRMFATSLIRPECPIYLTFDPAVAKERLIVEVSLKNQMARLLSNTFLSRNFAKPQARSAGTIIHLLNPDSADATSGSAIALAPNQIVYSDSGSLLHQAFETASGSQAVSEPGPALQRFIDELSLDQPPAGEDIAIALINQPERFENLLKAWEQNLGISGLLALVQQALNSQNVSFADIEGLKFSGDLITADKAKSELTLFFGNSTISQKALNGLKPLLSQVPAKQPGSPFEITLSARTRGSALLVTMELAGIRKWLDTIFPPLPGKAAASVTPPAAETTVTITTP